MLKRDLYYERIPTKSLRDDVRYLGNILGRVIKKQEGENFFNLVEKIRLLSKANKKNKNDKLRFKKIIYEIQKLSPKNIFKLSRAFNHFMNFINFSETIDVTFGLPSLSPPIHEPNSIGLKFFGRFFPICFKKIAFNLL